MNKDKKIRSLKWKLAKIMLLCWVLPFLVIIGLVGSYMLITQRENQMERLAAQAGLNTRTCAERLNGAIADSRQATYDGTLFEQYRQYRRQGSSGERIFSNGVQNYLNAQYSHKKNNIFTVLMLKEDPLNKHYTSYNFGTGGSYGMIQHFFSQDRDQVLELAKSLDTAVGFLKTDNGFYIVRNMMDRSFTAWGILVSRVNVNYCFEPVKTAWEDFHVQLNISGNPFVEAGKVVSIEDIRAEYPEYASNMKDDMIPASPADGVQYAVPFYGYWEGLYVNKAVMEAAGAEIPTADTTWDQFLETCQVIKTQAIPQSLLPLQKSRTTGSSLQFTITTAQRHTPQFRKLLTMQPERLGRLVLQISRTSMRKDSYPRTPTLQPVTRYSRASWKVNLHSILTAPGKWAVSKKEPMTLTTLP